MHAMAVIYHNVVMKGAWDNTKEQATGLTFCRNGIDMQWLICYLPIDAIDPGPSHLVSAGLVCVCACVRACVRACVCVYIYIYIYIYI